MPLYRRLPKRGFNPIKKNKIAKLNLENLQRLISSKRIKSEEIINLDSLKKSKILRKSYDKFKILGSGNITYKLDLEADFASKKTIIESYKKEKIENQQIISNDKYKSNILKKNILKFY